MDFWVKLFGQWVTHINWSDYKEIIIPFEFCYRPIVIQKWCWYSEIYQVHFSPVTILENIGNNSFAYLLSKHCVCLFSHVFCKAQLTLIINCALYSFDKIMPFHQKVHRSLSVYKTCLSVLKVPSSSAFHVQRRFLAFLLIC